MAILGKQIAEWRGEGFNFAANLLQHFIEKKGPQPYEFTEGDEDEVIARARPMVAAIIFRELQGSPAKDLNGKTIKFNGDVRWVENSLLGGLDTLSHAFAGEVVMANTAMFYTYGGAHMRVSGRVAVTEQDGRFLTFQVKVRVVLTDNYEFGEPGPGGVRLVFQAYNAAHQLQVRYNYKPFLTEMVYRQTFSEQTCWVKDNGNIYLRPR